MVTGAASDKARERRNQAVKAEGAGPTVTWWALLRKGKWYAEMSMRIMKWISLPVLLIGSVFSRFAGNFEFLVNLLACVGAMVVVQRAISFREYFWAAGFANLAIVFSPLTLLIKVFLVLSLTCVVALASVYSAWKTRRLAVLEVL